MIVALVLLSCAVDPSVVDAGPASVEHLGAAATTCTPAAPDVVVTEGERVELVVTCDDDVTLELVDPPAGAVLQGATFRWTPGLDAAGAWPVQVRATSPDGRASSLGRFVVRVADAWDVADNVQVDPLRYGEELGVPVLHVTVPAEASDDVAAPTTVVWRGEALTATVKYRGASSAYYPKRSYTLAFPAEQRFDAPGWRSRRSVVLTSTFDDNSYLRQLLCYEGWGLLDPTREPIQAMPVVVYLNGAYHGLYLLSDHVDGEWWEDAGFDEDGPLYKAVGHEANFRATYNDAPKWTWHDGYVMRGDTTAWEPLDALVAWASTSYDDAFAAELAARWEMEDLVDWWILVRWMAANDSGGKNAYLYFDAASGRWRHAPWDFNHALGQDWTSARVPATEDYDFYWSNHLFERALEDERLRPAWEARMRAALDGPLAKDTLLARYDAWQEHVAASGRRDWQKWGRAYRDAYGWRGDVVPPEQEWAYLRDWIAARADVMDGWYPP